MQQSKNLDVRERCVCPIGGIMDVISKRWSILIINTIGNEGIMRYSEIKRHLRGINTKTLSERLKEMERAGVIKRVVYPESPPKVEYSLTSSGIKLRETLIPLIKWTRVNAKELGTKTPCDVAMER